MQIFKLFGDLHDYLYLGYIAFNRFLKIEIRNEKLLCRPCVSCDVGIYAVARLFNLFTKTWPRGHGSGAVCENCGLPDYRA